MRNCMGWRLGRWRCYGPGYRMAATANRLADYRFEQNDRGGTHSGAPILVALPRPSCARYRYRSFLYDGGLANCAQCSRGVWHCKTCDSESSRGVGGGCTGVRRWPYTYLLANQVSVGASVGRRKLDSPEDTC